MTRDKNMACKHYNLPAPERPVIKGVVRQRTEDEYMPGQMSLENIPGVMP